VIAATMSSLGFLSAMASPVAAVMAAAAVASAILAYTAHKNAQTELGSVSRDIAALAADEQGHQYARKELAAFADTVRRAKEDLRSARDAAETAAQEQAQSAAVFKALDASTARIEFAMDGTILDANALFLEAMGYERDEVVGRHHRMFCDPREAESAAYAAFWEKLSAGAFDQGLYTRYGKDGQPRYIQATYAPVSGADGKPCKVVKYLTDVTAATETAREAAIKSAALDATSAPIMILDADGRVSSVNDAMRQLVETEAFRSRWPDLEVGDPILLSDYSAAEQTSLLTNPGRLPATLNVDAGHAKLELRVSGVFGVDGRHEGNVIGWRDVTEQRVQEGMLRAFDQTQALIEFTPDGTVTAVNDNFLSAVGYSREEVIGQHHSMFVPEEIRASSEYRSFWSRLAAGEAQSGMFRRFGKDGAERWLQATYVPIKDGDGQTFKVVKTATDVTEQTNANMHRRAILEAVDRTQAVIEFDLQGRIIKANDAFLKCLGYELGEIVGRHHSMFVDDTDAASDEYKAFWAKLAAGEYDAGKCRRVAKDGKSVVIQATYNPVFDTEGKPVRVVKFATDITEAERIATEAAYKSCAFEQSSTAMLMVDRDLTIQYINAAALRLFDAERATFAEALEDFDPHALIGCRIDDLHEDLQRIGQELADPANLPFQSDITLGETNISLAIGPVFDRTGNYVGSTLEWVDVSEERKANSVVASIEAAQAVIEFATDGTVRRINENFASAMGYTSGQVVGKHHRIFLFDDEVQDASYQTFWDRLAGGETITDQVQCKAADGSRVFLQASYIPVKDGRGNTSKVVKMATDVTARVASERAAAAAVEQERADNAAVVENLASGLQALSEGDLSIELNDLFPEQYRQLRYDFNDAVSKLRAAEELRAKVTHEQEHVVTTLAASLEKLSIGVLTGEIVESFPGQYDQLRADFNAALVRLREVMEAIVSTAEAIRSDSEQISKGADDLSKRTENQAATLEQTAAALDQITSTVRNTANGAAEASRVASATREEAQRSGEVVQNAVSAMGEIEKSSTQISQIITVIDDIAFQTNLLALNAGVEAARAGDAGRGFAVVAQEVRALAQRSSDAAKEIKALISTSGEQVERGVDLVGRAGKALSAIVERVESVSLLVADIASAAQEQSTSLAEVNQAMTRMDEVTQENAAMVEQSTAASHRLSGSSSALIERVTHFDTGGGSETSGPKPSSSYRSAPSRSAQPAVVQQREAAQAFFAGRSATAEKVENLDDNWEEF
jgi:methyl-accepting chemotaxis protein